MKEKPIIFSTEMVRAIMDGRKTQTRRPVVPQPLTDYVYLGRCMDTTGDRKRVGNAEWGKNYGVINSDKKISVKALCKVGDHLWVRETWADIPETSPGNLHYRASATIGDLEWFEENSWKWRPSMFMPRWASRIMLEVTGVRVERLRDITEFDAIKEGCLLPESGLELMKSFFRYPHRQVFIDVWDEIYGIKYPWVSNPWVFVYEFKKL